MGFQLSLVPRPTPSSVSVDNNIRIRVLLSTETEEQKKRGRPGNEASFNSCQSYTFTIYSGTVSLYIHLSFAPSLVILSSIIIRSSVRPCNVAARVYIMGFSNLIA